MDIFLSYLLRKLKHMCLQRQEGVLGEVLVLIFLGDFLEKNGDVSEVFEVFENPCEGEAPFQLQNPFAGVKLFLHGELDAGTGAPSYFCAMIRHLFPEALTGLGVGLYYDKRHKLRSHVRGKKEFPMGANKLVTFNVKGRCDFDQDFNQKNPIGAAEFSWNKMNFKEDQDVRIKVGYEMFNKVPYMQIRENNWTLNANMKGKWNLRFDL
ncbi:hypothetical protein YC2023_078660 [Brassica napus]